MHTHSMYSFLQNYVRWFDNIHIKISYFYPNTYRCCDCIVELYCFFSKFYKYQSKTIVAISIFIFIVPAADQINHRNRQKSFPVPSRRNKTK